MITVSSISGDEYLCFCPLHDDKNPSLSINVKKNAAICFAGCFEGSVSDLISKVEKVPRSAAWRKMITGSAFDFDLDSTRALYKSEAINFNGVNWVPGDYTEYLLSRKFNRSTIRFWGIEFSSEIQHIRIPVIRKDQKLSCYSYRTLDDSIKPKYLHPGLKKKEGILFGENFFEPHNGIVNLVEGPLDCIWLFQNGFTNSLAFIGTPTKEQIENIFDYGSKFRLCFDNDQAGLTYSKKVIKEVEKRGCSYWCIELPEDKDVQDLSVEELLGVMK